MKLVLIIFASGFVNLTAAFAQAPQKTSSDAKSQGFTASANRKKASTMNRVVRWTWATVPWTGDRKPYQKAIEEIDKAVSQGQNPDVLRRQYEAVASKKPFEPLPQFRWAYAARLAGRLSAPFDTGKLTGVQEALDRAANPRVYDYTRIRFLVDSYSLLREDYPALRAGGERLLKFDPNDEIVKFQFISVLITSKAPAFKLKALPLAKELLKADPKKAVYHWRIATVYAEIAQLKKDKHLRTSAIAEYRQYLNLIPKNSKQREIAQTYVDWQIKHLQNFK